MPRYTSDHIEEIEKIDLQSSDGLSATDGSLGYGIKELERHFHNRERWWGAVAVPDETNAIDANVNRPYVATSGNNTWGAAIPIIGTGDNPCAGGSDVNFDLHRVFVTDLSNDTTPWRFRVIWGTGTSAAAISAGQWSEIMVEANAVPGNRAGGMPIDIMMRRVAVGAKCWVQVWNVTNALTMDFFIGVHGYEG